MPLLKRLFLYPKINPKGCIHAIQVDSDTNFFIKNSLFTISIHAARVGSDIGFGCRQRWPTLFQSTLPVWAATLQSSTEKKSEEISIHAARVGSDALTITGRPCPCNFNPRCPCGQRPKRWLKWQIRCIFQSTLPVWAATVMSLKS